MNDQLNQTSDDASRGFPQRDGGFLTTVRRAARFGAGLLRAVAGAPAGVERTRRGSFLVLVVATLALMSVFAVVYVTIGKADAGTQRGVKKGESRDDVPNQLADHVAKIIGDDIFATVNVGVDSAGPINIREVTDIPGVNWTDRSDSTNPDDSFNPIGTFTGEWTGSGTDPRAGSDPFLASSEPTYLGFKDDGATRTTFLQMQDWAAISNVAPDGRFVNLHNLRNKFDATPQQMQTSMTLLDEEGKPTNQLDFGGVLNFNIPAHLTNRQRGLFRPANTIVKGDPDGQSPSDPNYLDYHYADTDGDGFYDARWFEMIDAHDLSKIKNLLKTDDGMRYFFAVRVEDLSGRANVLTAMDMKGAPTVDPKNTIGLVPEVDFRRVLSLIDPFSDDPSDPDLKLGYAGMQQPDSKLDPQAKLAENYVKYLPGLSGAMSQLVGDFAYHALHNDTAPDQGALFTGLIPPAPINQSSNAFTYPEPQNRALIYNELLGFGRGVSSTGELSALTSIEDLAELLTYRGINDPSVTSQLELLLGGRYRDKPMGKDPDRETVRFSPLRDNRPLALERDVDNRDGDVSVGSPDGLADIDAMLRSAYDVRQRITTLSGSRPLMATRVTLPTSQDRITIADLRRTLSTDTSMLYGIYADTLIPDSTSEYAWTNKPSDVEFMKSRFANYGANSAEFGARISAHMAANFRAATDSTSSSSYAYTVLLDEDFRPMLSQDWADQNQRSEGKPIASRVNQWAWWVDNQGGVGKLDIGKDWDNPNNTDSTLRSKSRLGDSASGDVLESKAINVYGITAQPVLTAAASFYVYTDIPTKATAADYGKAGDQEWEEDIVNGTFIPKDITIDGSVSKDNEDFLMQVIAFQITNPFDTTIYLTQDGMSDGQSLLLQDRFEYYIEFGGRYFRLANFDALNPSMNFSAAALGPGDTRVFYAMCLPLQSTTGQDIVSRWNATKKTFTPEKVKEWLDKQMTVTMGSGDKLPTMIEEFNPETGARKIQTDFVDLLTNDASSISADKTTGMVRLWRALRTPTTETGPTNEDPKDLQKDALPKQYIANDQLIDRLRDPNAATASTFDQKLVLTGTNNAEIPGSNGGPDNISSADPRDNTGFSITRFGLVRRNADPAGGSFDPRTDGAPAYMLEGKWSSTTITNQTDTGPANASIDRSTFSGSGDGTGYERILLLHGSESTNPVLPGRELTTEPRAWSKGTIPANASGQAYIDIRTSFVRGLRSESVRVADLLLPLGIGPEFDPFAASPNERYLTLGESLANALDYDSPAGTFLYYGMGKASSGPTDFEYPKLDRGQLVLDRFVPFYDADSNGAYDRATGQDQVRGQGVPLALTIFDRVDGLSAELWGTDRPVIGRINVNTASRTVLRSVGVLSPTPSTSTGDWWWTGSNLDQKSDIATTLIAYRDKGLAWTRISSPTATGKPVDFRDGSSVKPDEFDKLNGRSESTLVSALREAPGVSSVGELLLAKKLDKSNLGATRKDPNNVDFLGYNDAIDAKAGVSVGVDPSTTVKDSFAERLQIAASAANALSTRSDFFAVWFIVRGYRPSDVNGLSNNDPMVPSVQRRFVMVVDRSNVVKYGQKPRILLLKEVPF